MHRLCKVGCKAHASWPLYDGSHGDAFPDSIDDGADVELEGMDFDVESEDDVSCADGDDGGKDSDCSDADEVDACEEQAEDDADVNDMLMAICKLPCRV